ncbi:hypothetical protein ACNF42_01840 [Cuniculiplasma sp. SKW3]|uniref:hypothetical protein n=1 Tax=unclassified Cuniculiplasma TaxID=2619706 RepID=UPI003FD12EB8
MSCFNGYVSPHGLGIADHREKHPYSMVSHDTIDSVRYFKYIMEDSAYDIFEMYDCVFENTHSIPVIDRNARRGIETDRLSINRKIVINLRKENS